jgi:hypothetical protein
MRGGHLSTIVFQLDNCRRAAAPAGGVRALECAGNTAAKCVAIGNLRHSLLLIIVGSFVRAAAIFVPGPRNVRFRIADFPRFSFLCDPSRLGANGSFRIMAAAVLGKPTFHQRPYTLADIPIAGVNGSGPTFFTSAFEGTAVMANPPRSDHRVERRRGGLGGFRQG